MQKVSRYSRISWWQSVTVAYALLASGAAMAVEDIEFVAEHLAEVAMDSRYASLPLWGAAGGQAPSNRWSLQVGWTDNSTGGLTLRGPLTAVSWQRDLTDQWSMSLVGAAAELSARASSDRRPLQVSFVRSVPLALPALAQFDASFGNMRELDLGIAFERRGDGRLLGRRRYLVGLLAERVELNSYAFDYRVLAGASNGASGRIDYSNSVKFATTLLGLSLPRSRGSWDITPHALLAVPLPRRGMRGRISGPSFVLSGDTANAAGDKPFGDPAVVLGLDLTYRPWGLSVDLGAAVWQTLAERWVHEGIDRNWILSVRWAPRK